MPLVAGGVGGAAGLVWLRCIYLVVTSRFVTDPAFDPHGYGLIAGSVLSLPAALVTAMAVPFAFPVRHRVRVARITTPILLMGTASVWAVFLTA
jgi:hypothetical protein